MQDGSPVSRHVKSETEYAGEQLSRRAALLDRQRERIQQMNSLSRQRHAIANWIDDTRQHSNRIDLEAESRLGRLAQLPFTNLEAATSSPVTLGLYGHSTEGKHHL